MSPLPKALPFWLSLCLPPIAVLGMVQGGWTIALLPLVDLVALHAPGRDDRPATPTTPTRRPPTTP
jgi:hypothetical protein